MPYFQYPYAAATQYPTMPYPQNIPAPILAQVPQNQAMYNQYQ